VRATITTFEQFEPFSAHVKSNDYCPSGVTLMILLRIVSLSGDIRCAMIFKGHNGPDLVMVAATIAMGSCQYAVTNCTRNCCFFTKISEVTSNSTQISGASAVNPCEMRTFFGSSATPNCSFRISFSNVGGMISKNSPIDGSRTPVFPFSFDDLLYQLME
jgi:hypothetical protein